MNVRFNYDSQILFESELIERNNLRNTISEHLDHDTFLRRNSFDLKNTITKEEFKIPLILLSIKYSDRVLNNDLSIIKEVFYGIQEYKTTLLKEINKDTKRIPLEVVKELDSIINTRVKIDNYTIIT